MKTLKEYNPYAYNRSIDTINEFGKPRKNGIACDECGDELWDSNPSVTLTSLPAQKNVHCDKCGFRGYRYV